MEAIRRGRLQLVPALANHSYVPDDELETRALEKLLGALEEALAELPVKSRLRLPLLRVVRAVRDELRPRNRPGR
jgi:hypothetical protein